MLKKKYQPVPRKNITPKKVSNLIKKFYKKLKLGIFLEKKKIIYRIIYRRKKKLLKSLKKKLRKRKKVRRYEVFSRKYKPGPSHGVIHLLCNKRSIFCTLSDAKGGIKASVSTGILRVKGKKRKSYYYVPKTAQLLVNYIFKIPYRKFVVKIKGNAFKKKKIILFKYFVRIKKFTYWRLDNLAPRSHNGCRLPKPRRK